MNKPCRSCCELERLARLRIMVAGARPSFEDPCLVRDLGSEDGGGFPRSCLLAELPVAGTAAPH